MSPGRGIHSGCDAECYAAPERGPPVGYTALHMARRQEQEPARSEVTEVAPNVLRLELPIAMPGLGHVNCYALVDSRGAALVDPGLPGPASWVALERRLRTAGLRVSDVHSVVVTHSHPDHFGGAVRLRRESGARILAHRDFCFGGAAAAPEASVDDLDAQASDDAERDARRPRTPGRGAPPWGTGRTPWGGTRPRPGWRVRLRWMAMRWFSRLSMVPEVTDPLEEDDLILLAGRHWRVVHTPGHTADHFCLHDPETGTFLAGDHVLPTITPHISGLDGEADPLRAFFDSLDRVAELHQVDLCLPAHGHPFRDLRARTEEIKRHHHERLARVKAISREIGRPATVTQFSQRLFKRRSWGPMAESETYAHLEHLRHAGQAESFRDRSGSLLYRAG